MNYRVIGSDDHKRISLGILMGSMVNFALMYAPQPLISLYSDQYNIPPSTASLSISLTSMSLSISLIFISIFVGVWNRKVIMSWSLIISSCLTILSAFIWDFNLYLIIRLLQGITIAGFPSIAMTYLNEEFSPKDIGTVMGYYVSGTAIGGLTGRIMTGYLTDRFNWHMAFLVIGLLCLVISIWFLIYLPNSNNFNKTRISLGRSSSLLKVSIFNLKLLRFYLTGFILMGAYVTVVNFIGYPFTNPTYNLSQTLLGFLFVVNIFGIYSATFFGKLSDHYPRQRIMTMTILVLSVGMLLTLHPSLIVKILGLSVFVSGFFAGHTIASSWIGIYSSSNQKGSASALYLLFYYLGSSCIGWLGGLFLKAQAWQGIVLFVSCLLLVAFLISLLPLNEKEAIDCDEIS